MPTTTASRRLLVVTHTHWDREWYHTAERFRQRLVPLIDAALAPRRPPRPPLLLDGQAIVLEDYLAVRPDAAPALREALADGRIDAGPWYVLADLLMPRGESHIRNLLAGRRVLARLGGRPPAVWYAPDAFGHPHYVPTIADGFAFPLVILWRGHGGVSDPPHDLASWANADGASTLLYHLPPDGYEFGSALPVDADGAAHRAQRIHDVLAPRCTTHVTVLTVGADHHAVDPQVSHAVDRLRESLAPLGWTVETARLDDAAVQLRRAAAMHALHTMRGERRDSYGYTWTLQGTFATRTRQKRLHAALERRLLDVVEPLAALAWASAAHRAPSTDGQIAAHTLPALLDACWQSLLQCQPHDTLCGCSIDAVARAMDVRLDAVASQLDGLTVAARDLLLGHDRVQARGAPQEWHTALVAMNPVSHARRGVARVRLVRLRQHEPVGPGSAARQGAPAALDPPPARIAGLGAVQWIDGHDTRERLESPLHYPDNDLVRVDHGLAWIDRALPAWSLQPLELTPSTDATDSAAAHAVPSVRVAHEGDEIVLSTADVEVRVGVAGLSVRDAVGSWSTGSLVTLIDEDDLGDCYTPSPRGAPRRATITTISLIESGPWRATVRAECAFPTRTPQSPGDELALQVSVEAGSRAVCVTMRGTNTRQDHRLRLLISSDAADAADATYLADSGYGNVWRTPLAVTDAAQQAERVTQAAPLHRWLAMPIGDTAAMVLVADGVPEVERLENGAMACTVLRATGELSRADLPERPGHAGWPAHTPQAQEPGPFSATVWLARVHESRDRLAAAADALATALLHPLDIDTLRDARTLRETGALLALEGDGLAVLAIKPSEDRSALIVRCINRTDATQHGRWRLGFPIAAAARARLDETVVAPIVPVDGAVPITVAPHAVETVRLSLPR
ncbi:MAG: hypothetical protein MUF00_07290 [Gemmatimonadaceae bacterium]|nr:hypothetical protein [Gemmatimonadaceae bacterium]